jgi:hypothetical protein
MTKTNETPSADVERNSSMLMVLTASSILSVISVSTSCGAAPGNRGDGWEFDSQESLNNQPVVREDAEDDQGQHQHRGKHRRRTQISASFA